MKEPAAAGNVCSPLLTQIFPILPLLTRGKNPTQPQKQKNSPTQTTLKREGAHKRRIAIGIQLPLDISKPASACYKLHN
jgi:hypothetical protein